MTKCDFCEVSRIKDGKATCPWYTPAEWRCRDAIKHMVKALGKGNKK